MRCIRFDNSAKLKELLSKVEMFRNLPQLDLPKIAGLCDNVQFFDPGEVIIRKGEVETNFFILLAGTARVSESMDLDSILTLKPGSLFGEISFLCNTQRTKNVIANDNVFALSISRKMLQRLQPAIRDRIKDCLIEKLVQRIREIEGNC